jgi:spore coat protein U-like protein
MAPPQPRWRAWTALAGLLAAGGTPGPAAVAATATASFTVTAVVQATCLIQVTSLVFATYTGLVDPATSSITITCTNTTPYTVGLGVGLAGGATVTSRAMTAGTAALAYVMTSDAAHAINWGQTVGTDTIAGTGTGTAQVLTVYGQIAAGQYVTPGTYNDTIIATVSY